MAETVDLLVTDIVMPNLGGRELAARLLVERPGVRVLFMSGYPDDARELGELAGSTGDLLRKPFSLRELVERARAALPPRAAATFADSSAGLRRSPPGEDEDGRRPVSRLRPAAGRAGAAGARLLPAVPPALQLQPDPLDARVALSPAADLPLEPAALDVEDHRPRDAEGPPLDEREEPAHEADGEHRPAERQEGEPHEVVAIPGEAAAARRGRVRHLRTGNRPSRASRTIRFASSGKSASSIQSRYSGFFAATSASVWPRLPPKLKTAAPSRQTKRLSASTQRPSTGAVKAARASIPRGRSVVAPQLPREDLGGGDRVGEGRVGARVLAPDEGADGGREVARLLAEVDDLGVDDAPPVEGEGDLDPVELAAEERDVEAAQVVAREVAPLEEGGEVGGDGGEGGGVRHVGVGDPVDGRRLGGIFTPGFTRVLEDRDAAVGGDLQGRHLDDPVGEAVGTGRLEVEDDERGAVAEVPEELEGLGGEGCGHAGIISDAGASNVQAVPAGRPGRVLPDDPDGAEERRGPGAGGSRPASGS